VPADRKASVPRQGYAIRPAGPGDVGWLAALAERTFRETYAAFNRPEDMESYVASHFGPTLQAAELTRPTLATLVAEAEGRGSGYVQLGWGPVPACVTGPAPAEVVRFYVDRPWHGRGVAQALMAAATDLASLRGVRTLWLGVWERNDRATAFYRKAGFTDVGTQTFVLGADHQRDIVLARAID
jgi:GNAT superfamily N-acetyltransferase